MKKPSSENQNDLELSPEQWKEIEDRKNEMRSGKVKTITHVELMKKLREKLHQIK